MVCTYSGGHVKLYWETISGLLVKFKGFDCVMFEVVEVESTRIPYPKHDKIMGQHGNSGAINP